MDTEKKICIVAAAALALVLCFAAWVGCTHAGRAAWNLWFGSVQKVDDATNYRAVDKVQF